VWLDGHAEPSQFLEGQFFDGQQVLEHSLADPPQRFELLNVELVEQVRAVTLTVTDHYGVASAPATKVVTVG
jgi:Flp pilus assembly protein CpaB